MYHPKETAIPPPYHIEAAAYRAVSRHPRPRHLTRLRKLVSKGKLPWLSRFKDWKTWSVQQKNVKIRALLPCVGPVLDAVDEEGPELQATLASVRSFMHPMGEDDVPKPHRNLSYRKQFAEVMRKKDLDSGAIPRCTGDILDIAEIFSLDPLFVLCFTEAFMDAVDQEGIHPEAEVEAIAEEVEAELEARRRLSRARKRAKRSADQASVLQLPTPPPTSSSHPSQGNQPQTNALPVSTWTLPIRSRR